MPPKKQNTSSTTKASSGKLSKKQDKDEDFFAVLNQHNKETRDDKQKCLAEMQKAKKKADADAQKKTVEDPIAVKIVKMVEEKMAGDIPKGYEKLVADTGIYVDVVAKQLYDVLGGERDQERNEKRKVNSVFLAYALNAFFVYCMEKGRKLYVKQPLVPTSQTEGNSTVLTLEEDEVVGLEIHSHTSRPNHSHKWNVFHTKRGDTYCIDMALPQLIEAKVYRGILTPEVPGYFPILAASRLLISPQNPPAPHCGDITVDAGMFPRPSYEGKFSLAEGIPAGTTKNYRIFLAKSQAKCATGLDESEEKMARQMSGAQAAQLERFHEGLVGAFFTQMVKQHIEGMKATKKSKASEGGEGEKTEKK